MTNKEATQTVSRICTVLSINFKTLTSKSRKSNTILQRRSFMKLLSNAGMTTKNVGLIFNQSHSSVIYSNKKHNDLLYVKDKMYTSVFEKIKKEFMLRVETLDSAIQSLLELLMNENNARHYTLIELSRKNKELNKEIKYLKNQVNILNK